MTSFSADDEYSQTKTYIRVLQKSNEREKETGLPDFDISGLAGGVKTGL